MTVHDWTPHLLNTLVHGYGQPPNNNLGLAMPQKFILSLCHWLWVPLFSSASKLCSCGHHLDHFGNHLLRCGQGNWRTRHHDALCDVIFNALLVDNVNCQKEQICNSNNNTRPGDVFHPDFEQGLLAYFDLTVKNSLQSLYIAQAVQRAGVAAEAGEKEKDCRHEGLVTATGSVFHPLVVESLELWSPHSLKVIKTIARRLAFHGNLSVSKANTNLHEQLSVKLWLYNAKMLLHRLSLDYRESALLDL